MSGQNRTPTPFNILHQPHQQYKQLQFEKYTQKKTRNDQQIKSPNEKIRHFNFEFKLMKKN